MMTISNIPTRTELVQAAHEMIPLLQAHTTWHEQHRRLHDETIEALAQAGIFKLRVPKRYGGYESDTRTLVEVLAELGQGDGSTAWVAKHFASSRPDKFGGVSVSYEALGVPLLGDVLATLERFGSATGERVSLLRSCSTSLCNPWVFAI